MKAKPLMVLLLALVMLGACNMRNTPKQQRIATPEGWTWHERPDCQVMYPEEYELNLSGMMGSQFIIFSPLEGEDDAFGENLNLVIEELPSSQVSLEEYKRASIEVLQRVITNLEVEEASITEQENGVSHIKLLSTGLQGTFHITFRQQAWIKDGKAYVLSFVGETDKYSNYTEVAELMMRSFVLH